MRKVWYLLFSVLIFLLGYYAHYHQVHERIATVGKLVLSGEVQVSLQESPYDGTIIGVQISNGTAGHIVVTAVTDKEDRLAEFVQFHMVKPVGRGYQEAGLAVPLMDVVANRSYGILLPGDNAVLRFPDGAESGLLKFNTTPLVMNGPSSKFNR